MDPNLNPFQADIHDERSVAEAVAGAYGVDNAVSLYVERGNDTFHSVHVKSAKRVAAQALSAGVERLRARFGNWRRSGLAVALHKKAR